MVGEFVKGDNLTHHYIFCLKKNWLKKEHSFCLNYILFPATTLTHSFSSVIKALKIWAHEFISELYTALSAYLVLRQPKVTKMNEYPQ